MKFLFLQITFYLFVIVNITSCGGKEFEIDPLVKYKEKLSSEKLYTILLEDMDLIADQYKHKYKIITLKNERIFDSLTGWENVSDEFFMLHDKNLGMELLSKDTNARLNELISPPGFTNFIGINKYGFWQVNDTTVSSDTIWKFNEIFTDLPRILGIDSLEIKKTDYDLFLLKYYHNRPYYGEDETKPKYGTNGGYFIHSRPMFYSRKIKHNNFKKKYSHSSHNSNRGGGGYGK